eukprot:NODE_1682_length_1641_cov_11.893939_g1602_i0.p1 GENE.NODE_1682_length_1641_cov_11.893939_g1602_i0~~NODE_1682_length_1641_cov_11.893939_g1602_i0.p1  ORF type:complete len:484 (-),score=68.99 NODE_1682_length_1641_cov_11.893939_g1602_i0:115-1566(-)
MLNPHIPINTGLPMAYPHTLPQSSYFYSGPNVNAPPPGIVTHVTAPSQYSRPVFTAHPTDTSHLGNYKSFYDLPLELQRAEHPQVPNVDVNPKAVRVLRGPTTREPYYQPEYGKPLEFQRCRLRILAQRSQELKDHGPAVQIGELILYDEFGNPLDLRDCVARCPTGGFSEVDSSPMQAIDMDPSTKFLRMDLGEFPVDLEVDLIHRIPVSGYSWRTSAVGPMGRDPVSWLFQALVPHGWATLDRVTDYEVPRTRGTVVGPFRLEEETHPAPMLPNPDRGRAPQTLSFIPYELPAVRALHTANPHVANFSVPATQALADLIDDTNPGLPNICRPVEELLNKHANPNVRDQRGRTPLIKACARGDQELVVLLLHRNADPNSQAATGESSLHRAALLGDVTTLTTLLNAHADPNTQDAQGDTPLILAAARADPSCVQLLLEARARPDWSNSRGLNALQMLDNECQRGNVQAGAAEVRRVLGASTF